MELAWPTSLKNWWLAIWLNYKLLSAIAAAESSSSPKKHAVHD
ncbi:MAG: hypothetical protein JWR21_3270 [Herminiimonas sp.]|nr:hypothetical protein [Herminiimonas sp.]